MRDQIIRIRVTATERAKILELAKARGLSLSDMVRRAALGVRMPARAFDQTHITLIARILAELGRIGGNLNQLTRRANAGKLSGHDIELAATLAGIVALRDRVREIIQ